MKVYANAISRDDVAQKFHFKLMEFPFFKLGIKFDFPKLLQYKMYMALVICHVL
jgi:hypothetical protein